MNIIKNVFYAVCPLHCDLKRDKNNELTVNKNRGFVWTKRGIGFGLPALGFALLAITALSAAGVLPIGLTGQAILCATSVGVSALALLYQIGLGIGGIRTNKKILRIEKEKPRMYYEYNTDETKLSYSDSYDAGLPGLKYHES